MGSEIIGSNCGEGATKFAYGRSQNVNHINRSLHSAKFNNFIDYASVNFIFASLCSKGVLQGG